MNLPFINEGIFKPHKSLVEKGESSYIYIYIYISYKIVHLIMYIPLFNVVYHSDIQYSTSSHIPSNKRRHDINPSFHAKKIP